MKKLIIILMVMALSIPTLRVNYYNGEGMETRKQSVIGIVIQDIKNGTVGTGL